MSDLIPMNGGALPGFMAGRRASGSLAAARTGVQASFAVIGIKGKNWWLKKAGDEEVIRDQTSKRPVQHLDVVIVGVADSLSKTFYLSGFVEGERNAPDCMSSDGIHPDVGVPHKQHPVCATCPQNRFGSRTTPAGKPAKACSDQRKIAVVPLGDIFNEANGGPMLLRLPAMSLVNFKRYADELERKGASDIWWVGTRLEFDPEVAYQRVMFSPLGWVSEEQDAQIQALQDSGQIEEVLRSAPIELAPAAAAGPDISGTPPARARLTLPPTVIPMRPPVAQQTPEPPPEEDDAEGEPEAPPAPEPPPPPPAPAAQPQARTNPFQAQAPARGRPPTRVSPQTGRVSPQGAPTPAPMDLESAIDDLFSSTGGKP
jgi:hypothetical protein